MRPILRLVLLLAGAILVSCTRAPAHMHFTVPAGYTGPIAVVTDASFAPIEPDANQRYELPVSRTAVVCLDSDEAFRAHVLSAGYADGSPIYSNMKGMAVPPDEQAIRIAGFGAWGSATEGSQVIWYGIGTREEVEEFERLFFGGGIEDRMPGEIPDDSTFVPDNAEDFSHLSGYCGSEGR